MSPSGLTQQPDGLEVDVDDLEGTPNRAVTRVGEHRGEPRSGKQTRQTYIIPILLRKVYTRRSPLNASTVHQDVNATAHSVKRALEQGSDGRDITQIAVNDLGFHA